MAGQRTPHEPPIPYTHLMSHLWDTILGGGVIHEGETRMQPPD